MGCWSKQVCRIFISVGKRGCWRFISGFFGKEGLKGVWEKEDGLGSESANSLGVSLSELLNYEMVWIGVAVYHMRCCGCLGHEMVWLFITPSHNLTTPIMRPPMILQTPNPAHLPFPKTLSTLPFTKKNTNEPSAAPSSYTDETVFVDVASESMLDELLVYDGLGQRVKSKSGRIGDWRWRLDGYERERLRDPIWRLIVG